jgi:hypothetical protein
MLYGRNTSSTYPRTNMAFYYSDGSMSVFSFPTIGANSYLVAQSTPNKTLVSLIGYNNADGCYLYYDKCGIFEGALTVNDFKPYIEHTLPIPEFVQTFWDYGRGVNADYYNYITWNPDSNIKTWNKRVKGIDLGELNWKTVTVAATGVRLFYSDDIKATVYAPHYNKLNPFVSGKYANVSAEACSTIDKSISINNEGRIYVREDSITAADIFKASVSGVNFVYALVTPEVTDISAVLPDDNFIAVEEGGTVMAVNEYSYDVPTSITYQFKEGSL